METRRRHIRGNDGPNSQKMTVVKEERDDDDDPLEEDGLEDFALAGDCVTSSSEEEEPVPRKGKGRKPFTKSKYFSPRPVVTAAVPEVNLKIMPMFLGKRVSMSVKQKMEIIQWIKNGENHSRIATRLKLPRATISNVWAQREKIEKEASEGNWNKKRCRKQHLEGLDELLVSWINYMRQQGTPVSGTKIREHAKILARGLGYEDFSASQGWLEKFKLRNKVILPKARRHDRMLMEIAKKERLRDESKLEGAGGDLEVHEDVHDDMAADYPETDWEPSSVPRVKTTVGNKKCSSEWLSKTWPSISEGYDYSDIFFADAFGLFYRACPENCKDFQGLSCLEGEYAKERLSVLFGVNALGTEKLKLCVVGGVVNSSGFGAELSTSDQDMLATEYWSNSKAFVTPEVISSWLCGWNSKLEKVTGRKVLLLMRNCSVNQQVETLCSGLSCIKIVLPEDSILRYLESDIAQELKLRYKNLWIYKLIRQKKDESEATSILDATGMLHTAWLGIESTMITSIFRRSGLLKINEKGIENATVKNQSKLNKKLIREAKTVGIKFPKGFQFNDFMKLEKNLNAFTIWADALDDRSQYPVAGQLSSLPPPSTNRLFNDLDHLRGWAVKNCSFNLTALHEAISTIQNFCVTEIVLNDEISSNVPTSLHLDHASTELQSHPIHSRHNHLVETGQQMHYTDQVASRTPIVSTDDLSAISTSHGFNVSTTSTSNRASNYQQQQYIYQPPMSTNNVIHLPTFQ